jgi:hypothetical protein
MDFETALQGPEMFGCLAYRAVLSERACLINRHKYGRISPCGVCGRGAALAELRPLVDQEIKWKYLRLWPGWLARRGKGMPAVLSRQDAAAQGLRPIWR